MVHYFCNANQSYICRVDDLIKILKIKKKSDKIIFSISANQPYHLNLLFLFGTDCKEKWTIVLDPISPNNNLEELENLFSNVDKFPLSFKTDWSRLKDSANTWKQFTTTGDVIFEKDANTNLKIYFNEGQINCEFDYVNEEKFNVNYAYKDFFAISVPILNLIPVSSSSDLAKNLIIYLKEETTAIMYAKLDESFKTKKESIPNTETIVIKFFVPIKIN